MANLNVITLNVRGLNSCVKKHKIYSWLSENSFDVIFLQETHFKKNCNDKISTNWNGHVFHAFSDSPHSRGVTILFRKDLDIDVVNTYHSADGRRLLVNVKINDKGTTLVNVYAPNIEKERIHFFSRLKTFISQHSMFDNNMYLCGDFNCNFERQTDKSQGKLREMINMLDLVDLWKYKHPDLNGFTWCNANDFPTSRIDFIFVSKDIIDDITKVKIRRVPGTQPGGVRLSDHRYICCQTKIWKSQRGTGYWKLNVSHLDDEKYKAGILEIIDKLDSELDPISKWELFKHKVRDFSIHFSKSPENNLKLNLKKLERDIEIMENLPSSQMNMVKKKSLERDADLLYDKIAKGAQIRSKTNWLNEGERNTKFFLNLENKTQNNNTVKFIRNSNGQYVENNSEMFHEMCTYYEKLYKSKEIKDDCISQYLDDVNCNNLSQNEKSMCDATPTMEECKNAVFCMKKGKSPGSDGLPSEFYTCFWSAINKLFYDVLLCIFEKKEMSFSQRLSIITLVFKKGDRYDLKNYRPLSLTNTDYKIIAFIFANRLQKVVDKLIGTEQSAYIKGRYIGENARLILDVFDHCTDNNSNGILLFMDFEKAFDSVEWNFLFKVLQKFNFGESFISWMKILYQNPIFKIKNNGWLSKTCNMSRGIRQGCPISAILYIFAAEVLALKLKCNNQVNGIAIPGMYELKYVQHADDLTLMLKDELSVSKSLETVHDFCNHAGSKVNLNKTECILLGKLKDKYDNICGIKTSNNAIRCLGIYKGHNKIECYNKNWTDKYNQIQRLFELWKKRKLTIFGKVCIVNSLAMSKFTYVASVLPLPDDKFIQNVRRSIFNYIWNKTDRIKRSTVIGKILDGGIEIVDFELKLKAIKASWISRISKQSSTLYHLVNSYCKNTGFDLEYLLKSSERHFEKFDMASYLPKFYKEIFCFFNNCKKPINDVNLSSTDFVKQPLWNNEMFKYNGKTIFFKRWSQCNILYVKDLIDQDGNLLTLHRLSQTIQDKSNWLCEYKIIKSILNKRLLKFDTSNCHYTRHLIKRNFSFYTGFHNIVDKRCKFFYDNMLFKKFEKPCYQTILKREFSLEKEHWRNIYRNKIKQIYDKKVGEFNYKMLNNILCCNLYLHKCKLRASANCEHCQNDVENIKHLIFECNIVKDLWYKISAIVEFKVKWKHVMIGFFIENSNRTTFLNELISYVAFKIYKYKMTCRFENKRENKFDLSIYIRKSLVDFEFYINVTNKNITRFIPTVRRILELI